MNKVDALTHTANSFTIAGASASKYKSYEDAIASVFGSDSTKVALTVSNLANDALYDAIEDASYSDNATIDTKQIVSAINKQVENTRKGIKRDSTLGLYNVIQLCKKLSSSLGTNIDDLEEIRSNIHELKAIPKVGSKAAEYLYSKINPALTKDLEQMSQYVKKNLM